MTEQKKVTKVSDDGTVTTRTIKEQIVHVTKRKSSGDVGDDEEDNEPNITRAGLKKQAQTLKDISKHFTGENIKNQAKF